MNIKMTPEIQAALNEFPVGPIRLENSSDDQPVFLLRLDDIANLQELVDGRIQVKLTEADADIEAGRVLDWDVEKIKKRARSQYTTPNED